jgi:hypothetical protein
MMTPGKTVGSRCCMPCPAWKSFVTRVVSERETTLELFVVFAHQSWKQDSNRSWAQPGMARNGKRILVAARLSLSAGGGGGRSRRRRLRTRSLALWR